MATFLANENIPLAAVKAVRAAGVDLAAVGEISPGATDEEVLQLAQAERRVLVTFDKDFGELAFRQGKKSVWGVIFLRPRKRTPDYIANFILAVLAQQIDWEGNFCVAQEGTLRVVPLPK